MQFQYYFDALRFIPQVPLVQLLLWCRQKARQDVTGKTSKVIVKMVGSTTNLTNFYCGTIMHTAMEGVGMERWHGLWEAMRRILYTSEALYPEPRVFSQSEHYKLLLSSNRQLRSALPCVFQCKKEIDDFPSLIQSLSDAQSWTTYYGEIYDTPISCLNTRSNSVILLLTPENSFPAYDILIFDRDLGDFLNITLIQTKYAKTEKKKVEIDTVRKALMKAYFHWLPFVEHTTSSSEASSSEIGGSNPRQYPKGYFPALDDLCNSRKQWPKTGDNNSELRLGSLDLFGERIKPENFQFIFLSLRNCSSRSLDPYLGKLRKGLLVMTRKQLEELYGPTFFLRLQPFSKVILVSFGHLFLGCILIFFFLDGVHGD